MQTMAEQLGGKVESSDHREFGYAKIRARGHSKLLLNIEDHASPDGFGLLDVWMSHGDKVSVLPPGFVKIAATANSDHAAIADIRCSIYSSNL
jgi:GMP synthase (glutamine-hydrolysing)